MSDEQEHTRPAGRPGDRPELDRTAQFSSLSEESHPIGETRSGDADATRVIPSAAAPPARPDSTSIMPPLDLPDAGRSEAAARAAAGQAGPDDEVWTARAQVRPPRPGEGGDFTPADWAPPPAEPRRAWWMPILVGIVVLLLLGALGFGVWLITRGIDDDAEPATPATISAAPEPTAEPTTEPAVEPTTAQPTTEQPEPTTEQPTEVEVPDLIGQSSSDARTALEQLGLTSRVVVRRSSSAPAGTVIDSNPPEGRSVPEGTEVTLVVAAAAPSPSPPTSSPSPGEGEQEPPDED